MHYFVNKSKNRQADSFLYPLTRKCTRPYIHWTFLVNTRILGSFGAK